MIAGVSSYFRKLPTEVESMTYEAVMDANEVIWTVVENQERAMRAASKKP